LSPRIVAGVVPRIADANRDSAITVVHGRNGTRPEYRRTTDEEGAKSVRATMAR